MGIVKRKRKVPSLLRLHFLSLFFIFSGKVAAHVVTSSCLNYTNHIRKVGSMRLARIQRHLDKINKPHVLTIESPNGDIIDCVHKRNQPGLDHPLLKNHKIQRDPPQRPKSRILKEENSGVRGSEYNDSCKGIAWQVWNQKGERCPKGTVPVRRSTVQDVLRAKSLYDFGKKQATTELETSSIPNGGSRRINAPDVVSGNGHEHAIAYTGVSQEVYGAKATMNVWDPIVEEVNEFSLSQIWVLSGSFDGSDLNSIEAGWQTGFIQTNNRIAIGAAISPVSSVDGNQYDITILIWKDPKLGNWWLGFGESMVAVGYWPSELFTHLSDRATMVEWGGEVVNSGDNAHHTTTQMGSGHFAEDGFGKASYFRNLEIVDSDNSLSSPRGISTLAENVDCYNIKSDSNNEWGTHFYYGGPGNNPQCP